MLTLYFLFIRLTFDDNNLLLFYHTRLIVVDDPETAVASWEKKYDPSFRLVAMLGHQINDLGHKCGFPIYAVFFVMK